MAYIGHLRRLRLYKGGHRIALGRAEGEGKYYKTGYILHHAAQHDEASIASNVSCTVGDIV